MEGFTFKFPSVQSFEKYLVRIDARTVSDGHIVYMINMSQGLFRKILCKHNENDISFDSNASGETWIIHADSDDTTLTQELEGASIYAILSDSDINPDIINDATGEVINTVYIKEGTPEIFMFINKKRAADVEDGDYVQLGDDWDFSYIYSIHQATNLGMFGIFLPNQFDTEGNPLIALRHQQGANAEDDFLIYPPEFPVITMKLTFIGG
jgi:hypothetical protein